jgi:hypothetical protein
VACTADQANPGRLSCFSRSFHAVSATFPVSDRSHATPVKCKESIWSGYKHAAAIAMRPPKENPVIEKTEESGKAETAHAMTAAACAGSETSMFAPVFKISSPSPSGFTTKQERVLQHNLRQLRIPQTENQGMFEQEVGCCIVVNTAYRIQPGSLEGCTYPGN